MEPKPKPILSRDLSAHPSEMAARVADFEWASTPLGPMQAWPQSLQIAVGICLNSRFPMFVWWGPDHINIYNDAYIPMLGKRHPAALGRRARESWNDIWDVVGPQADAVFERGEATWNDRVLLVMERHGYTEETWFTWSYSPIPDGEGGIGGLFCAVTEETGRVLAERERDQLMARLETERARLADTFAQSPAFLAVLRGPRHEFEFANARYQELVGGRAKVGKPVAEMLPEIAEQGYIDVLDRVYRTGEPFVGSGSRVTLRRGASGTLGEFFLDFVYQPMRDAENRINGILVHGVDVTERYRAEAGFRELADAMPQIVFTADAEGNIDYFNRRWYEYTGLAQGSIGFETWKHVHTEEGLRRVVDAWPEALRTGQPYEIEYPLRRKDGVYRWHLGRALPIRDGAGNIVRWYGTNTDIDDRKRIEEKLATTLRSEQQARGEAELASRMKDEFLATLSHELRTPLNAILGWSHIIRKSQSIPKELERGADVIERNARAQATIIEDLLDMSAIISGKARIEMKELDLVAVARTAVESTRPAAEAKGVRVLLDADVFGNAEIRGDPNRLQQVLWNLLTNAIKFTAPEGRIQVTLRRGGQRAEIVVADSGEGISPDFLPHVFERFRQADSSTTRRHGGLGLGLAIVKQLVELHGGEIRAASPGLGKGASFIVTLPLAGARRETAQPESFGSHASAGITARPEDCEAVAGTNVLVVDDETDARDLTRQLLRECGANVDVAGSAAEALRLLAGRKYDVLVSDIGMPQEDGHGLMRHIRTQDPGGNGTIRAVALTAYARGEDIAKAMAAGFQLHAPKPVEPGILIALVASLARGRTHLSG
jgi:PAS domain S-box-containing protein